MRSIGAEYIVQDVVDLGGIKLASGDALDGFIERNAPAMVLRFSNPWFRLYQMPVSLAAAGRSADVAPCVNRLAPGRYWLVQNPSWRRR